MIFEIQEVLGSCGTIWDAILLNLLVSYVCYRDGCSDSNFFCFSIMSMQLGHSFSEQLNSLKYFQVVSKRRSRNMPIWWWKIFHLHKSLSFFASILLYFCHDKCYWIQFPRCIKVVVLSRNNHWVGHLIPGKVRETLVQSPIRVSYFHYGLQREEEKNICAFLSL